MSTEKNTLNRVMELLGYKKSVAIELAQKKSQDGATTFDSESFAVGDAITIVTEDGNIAVPEGEYALEDGTIVSVDGGGVIVEVATAGEETAEEEVVASNVPDAASQIPKTVIETMTKETHFAEEVTPVAEITSEEQGALVDNLAGLIDSVTPDAVTPEIAQAVATAIADKIVSITETEEGMAMIAEYKSKGKTKMSSHVDIKLAELMRENAELKNKLQSEEGSRTKFSPENKADNKLLFKLSPQRTETIQDRVMAQLFNN